MVESLTVSWSWHAVGHVAVVDGTLVFPHVPNAAGVYRLLLSDATGTRRQVYVGEADLLARRLQHYRTPGPSQQTNLRLNRIMVEVLEAGGSIAIEIATHAQAAVAGATLATLELTSKAARVLVERAAEVTAQRDGTVLLNR